MRKHETPHPLQMVMAANAPMLAKKAMQDGDPIHGYLPSGSVAGVIDDLPDAARSSIGLHHNDEAEQTLAALARLRKEPCPYPS